MSKFPPRGRRTQRSVGLSLKPPAVTSARSIVEQRIVGSKFYFDRGSKERAPSQNYNNTHLSRMNESFCSAAQCKSSQSIPKVQLTKCNQDAAHRRCKRCQCGISHVRVFAMQHCSFIIAGACSDAIITIFQHSPMIPMYN